jgi:hypothetical protein
LDDDNGNRSIWADSAYRSSNFESKAITVGFTARAASNAP